MGNNLKNNGFTLVESLFALLILSIVGFSALNYTSSSIKNQIVLENKTFAAIVAHNQITKIRITKNFYNNLNELSEVKLAGKEWLVETDITDSDESDLKKILVKVFLKPEKAKGFKKNKLVFELKSFL